MSRRRRIRKIVTVRPLSSPPPNKLKGVRIPEKRTRKNKSIIITPDLYENNENYSNSLSGEDKKILFNALDNYAKGKVIEAKNTNELPIVNMVFHGHWGWVFGMMVNQYKNHIPNCNIISSVNPIPGCDVYQYWRPASNEMAKLLKDYPETHNFFRKGIHMVHDSPYDASRANAAMRVNTMKAYHTVICTSLEQKKYYENRVSGNTQFKYIPLGVSNDFVKKNYVNNITENKIKLGFIGRLYWDKIKGEEDLIALASKLDSSKFEFVILSPNADTYVSQLRMLGFNVYDNQSNSFHSLYKMIDVTLILSKHEGTPLPLIESIKLGTCVLGKPVGEVPVVLSEEYIIKSMFDLKLKLNEIWGNRKILQEFYDKSDEMIKDRTWKNFTKETEKIWKQIW